MEGLIRLLKTASRQSVKIGGSDFFRQDGGRETAQGLFYLTQSFAITEKCSTFASMNAIRRFESHSGCFVKRGKAALFLASKH